ncbi:MAG TPA: hypothetical protein VLE70_16380 [Anaerolineae bacterium]|jgi:ABC-type transporter Mla subunit MlaD|nr:hypothetical protein [Anaerolineae bacterium]
MVRRVIGGVLILVGLSGLVFSYVGARMGREVVDGVAVSLDSAVETAAETLDTVEATLEQSRQTIASVNATVAQVQTTTENLSTTVDDSGPMLDELALLVGESIPNTIVDLQNTIPNIAQTAKVVDDTLRLLSKLQIEERVPIINYQISIGLGVDYDPEIPFDRAVEEVGNGLTPIAETSLNLENELNATGANMDMLGQNLGDLAHSLGEMNADLAGFRPLLDEYSSLVSDIQEDLATAQAKLNGQVAAVKRGVLLVAIWFALFQLLPIYFGFELVMGNRMVQKAGRSEE